MMWLPDGKDFVILAWFVYQSVTDGRTDGRMDRQTCRPDAYPGFAKIWTTSSAEHRSMKTVWGRLAKPLVGH